MLNDFGFEEKGERFVSVFTKMELDKLSVMYDGDKGRDATSKIRGFLFQDYVTIMCLLKNQVEYVCSEYLEDVDVFFENGTFEFIQVKYYPNTNPNMKEISTDLYYQYLRLQMLHSTAFKENGAVRCPVCGSESFATMEEKLILKEADDYIRQNGETVSVKEVEKTSLQAEIDALYQKIINRAKTVVDKEKETLATEIGDLKVLKDEIQPYFDEVKKLQKTRKEINVEELSSEKVGELLAAV